MHRRVELVALSSSLGSNRSDAIAQNSPLLPPQNSQPRGVAADDAEQPLFYHVSMRDITDALLVPADTVSAKLQSLAPAPANESAVVSPLTPRSCGSDGASSVSSATIADVSPATCSPRQARQHGTLRTAVASSPEGAYYAEETLVIGSLARRGSLVANEPQLQRESSSAALPSADNVSGLLASQSSPGSAVGSSTLSRQPGDVSPSSSLRDITFFVRRASGNERDVDNALGDTEALEEPFVTDGVNASRRNAKKKKRVHFPENVIKSVSVLQADDQLRLLVRYNRPWYAHFVLLVASIFFVLHWGFIALLTVPSNTGERVAASAIISFVAFGFASVYLLAFLALTWRPGVDELEFLTDFSRNRPVLYVLMAGVVAQLSLVVSFMFSINVVLIISVCCIPLVVTYLYEEYKKHGVSVLDAIGCILVFGSIIVFFLGAKSEDDALYRRLLSVGVALVGGAAMAFFLFQVRTVSQYVSNFFVMSSTITLTTLVLAAVAYVTDGFSVPITASHKKLTDISSNDFLKILLSALFLFLSWFTYHWSSLFFDRMTLSGSFCLGGPISLLVFYLLSLPAASLPYEIGGGVAVTIGCGLVLFSGFRFRQNIEVQIELERA